MVTILNAGPVFVVCLEGSSVKEDDELFILAGKHTEK